MHSDPATPTATDEDKVLRKACERCRTRKLSCTGVGVTGKCRRCEAGNHDCIFSTRAPTGRPRKAESSGRRVGVKLESTPYTSPRKRPDESDADTSAKMKRTDGFSEHPSSLTDLSLAIFLDSLQTVEIAPSDGLTETMLQPTLQADAAPAPNTAPTGPPQYAESVALRQDLAYTVPADMSWWNIAWDLPDMGTGTPPEQPTPPALPEPAPAPAPAPVKTCCSAGGAGPNPLRTPCESSAVQELMPPPQTSFPPGLPSTAGQIHNIHDKVHCAPNPSGNGCTCLCDMSPALLCLEHRLRHRSDTVQDASSSLVFTLSSIQEVTSKCQCSADCPTCRQNPSTRLTASLLISTALQIYARALQIVRNVLVGNDKVYEHHVLEVSIGGFRPSARNARKIAIYALKLELHDLERALARVSSTAQSSRIAAVPAGDQVALQMNPVDQLVIRKLHQQLSEVLRTVESL